MKLKNKKLKAIFDKFRKNFRKGRENMLKSLAEPRIGDPHPKDNEQKDTLDF